ncbi:hypothetical protein QBA54_07710 [Streptomyces sp. B21-108]|uniref:hypothetical protein n=1 Tax=Streptomyces sp. B21-108 TaxID=3039419 RepID=UPI002FEFBF4F
MRAAEQTELIVLALRDHAAMVEEDAKAFLAEHDADVRADALAEGAALLRRQAGRKIGRPVHNSGLRTGAVLLERAADRPAPGVAEDSEPTFFQIGHAYVSGTWKFQCEALSPSPGTGEPRALGWKFAPVYEVHHWHAIALDPDDWAHGGWTDVTEAVSS